MIATNYLKRNWVNSMNRFLQCMIMISVMNLWKSFRWVACSLLKRTKSQARTQNQSHITTANIINVPVLTVCLFTEMFIWWIPHKNEDPRYSPFFFASYIALEKFWGSPWNSSRELLWAGTGFKCSIHSFISSLLIHELRPMHTKDDNHN